MGRADPRPIALRRGLAILLAILLGVSPVFSFASASHREIGIAPPSTPLTGGVNGPSDVGTGLKGDYEVTASGGPAIALNGTQVGTFSYHASLAGADLSNTSGITPSAGVLVNGSVNLTLIAPNTTQTITIFVLVTSSDTATNVSQNFSKVVNIIEPYRFEATLVDGASASTAPFNLTILLDGSPVGGVSVPLIAPGGSYPVDFSYVNSALSPGWHTFSVSLSKEHGLVVFSGGAEQFSQTFYVTGGATDYTIWYFAGAVAFFGAIVIYTSRVAARRRPKSKK